MGRDTPAEPPVTADLWLAPIAGPKAPMQDSALELLPPIERERWRRFATPELQDSFLRSRLHLRTVLGRYLDMALEEVPLASDARGKPYVAGTPYRFSLSHAGGWAVVAVVENASVGVDLEPERPVKDALAISRRFFPRVDHERLAALAPDRRNQAFMVAWTLKEAVAKADGRGIALLPLLITGVERVSPPGVVLDVDGYSYAAASFKAPLGLIGAVAVNGARIAFSTGGAKVSSN